MVLRDQLATIFTMSAGDFDMLKARVLSVIGVVTDATEFSMDCRASIEAGFVVYSPASGFRKNQFSSHTWCVCSDIDVPTKWGRRYRFHKPCMLEYVGFTGTQRLEHTR